MEPAKSIQRDENGYDNNGNGGLLTNPEDIKNLYESLVDITKGLAICIGSVFKVDSESYKNWGIGITDENTDFLKEQSAFFYDKDYWERRINGDIDDILRTQFKVSIERNMAELIAVTVREVLADIDDGDRSFNVCVVPSRDGKLSADIASALYRLNAATRSILERTTFHLVDLSGTKLDRAEDTLRQFRVTTHTYKANDNELFGRMSAGSFDIVASIAHFHHKSFLVDYLSKINRLLARKGVLLIGDWHSPLCSHPKNIVHLFRNLNLGHQKLEQFNQLMKKQLSRETAIIHSEGEMSAMMDHILHWKRVAYKLSEGSFSPKPRVYILGAHDTTDQREKKLDASGFTIDRDKVHKAFPRVTLPEFTKPGKALRTLSGKSDSAALMMAVKR